MSIDEIFFKIWKEVEHSEMDKKDIAKEANVHANTMRRVLEKNRGDFRTVVKIAEAVGLEITVRKKNGN